MQADEQEHNQKPDASSSEDGNLLNSHEQIPENVLDSISLVLESLSEWERERLGKTRKQDTNRTAGE